jgi:hypothetical protein
MRAYSLVSLKSDGRVPSLDEEGFKFKLAVGALKTIPPLICFVKRDFASRRRFSAASPLSEALCGIVACGKERGASSMR